MSTGAVDQCLVTDIDPHVDPDSDTTLELAATPPAPAYDTATNDNFPPQFVPSMSVVVTDLDVQVVVTEIEG